jgi:hypothetical protein
LSVRCGAASSRPRSPITLPADTRAMSIRRPVAARSRAASSNMRSSRSTGAFELQRPSSTSSGATDPRRSAGGERSLRARSCKLLHRRPIWMGQGHFCLLTDRGHRDRSSWKRRRRIGALEPPPSRDAPTCCSSWRRAERSRLYRAGPHPSVELLHRMASTSMDGVDGCEDASGHTPGHEAHDDEEERNPTASRTRSSRVPGAPEELTQDDPRTLTGARAELRKLQEEEIAVPRRPGVPAEAHRRHLPRGRDRGVRTTAGMRSHGRGRSLYVESKPSRSRSSGRGFMR